MVEDLYDTFYKELVRFCRHMNPSGAEDLVQETFLRALGCQDELEGLSIAQQRSWLYQTAKHLAIDQARRQIRETCVEQEELDRENFEEDLSTIAVRQMLSRIPPLEAAIFELRYFQGYNATELGKLMGVSPSTIRARLASARKHLRIQMADTHH